MTGWNLTPDHFLLLRQAEWCRRAEDWLLVAWLPRGATLWRWAVYDVAGFVSCSAITEDTETAQEAMDNADAWLTARRAELQAGTLEALREANRAAYSAWVEADSCNNAEAFWAHPDAPTDRGDKFAAGREEWAAWQRIPGFADGPSHAPTALVLVEE